MSGTLSGLAQRLNAYGIRVEEGADEMVRRVALAADQAVVSATPVDTGRARSNWLVSLSSARTDVIDPYVPGAAGSTGGDNTREALDQARAVVAGYRGGSAVIIANNLDYIQKLNDGWSRQAPANYVQTAVEAAVNAVGGTTILRP